jgi:hypothetical protein
MRASRVLNGILLPVEETHAPWQCGTSLMSDYCKCTCKSKVVPLLSAKPWRCTGSIKVNKPYIYFGNRPCHSSGGYSPASHHGAPGSSPVRPCGIRGGQSGAGAGFLRVLRFPLPILIPSTAPHSSSPIIRGW